MDSPPKGLTQEEFDLLLSKLDPDRETAGEQYTLLWQKLLTYFQSRACVVAEELVDETLNRVAKKIAGGEELRNLMAYSHGVAKMVWLEYLKKPGTNRGSFDDVPPTPASGADEINRKERQACFYKCLREIPIGEARLFVEYLHHDDRSNIDVRKEMAERLGITQTALRIRIFRIKNKLSDCVKKCLGEKPNSLK